MSEEEEDPIDEMCLDKKTSDRGYYYKEDDKEVKNGTKI